MDRRASVVAGIRDVAPFLLGIVPFGLVAGAAVVAAGLPPELAVGLSVLVFAGASQLAAIDLLGTGANAAVVVLTVLVINLRMMMYSASLAPYLDGLSLRERVPVAYLLTDQAFALSVTRFEADDVARPWYYLGVAASVWVVWQTCTVVGVVVGASVPESVPLEFAVPLTFLALLVPATKGRASGTAALVGGTVALVLATAPFNLGLVVGALAGVLAGVVAEHVVGTDPETRGEDRA
ncbi:AzlC family ABC transporter permease [Halomarina oriensis]|uniref:Branched-chain amino acid ABC transporter permease n=1 Tax=Halomarina oriensis TaxID=671145 RepID=A0A6B0GLW7_9EURY|nr:AzlC family ABC transporter permease [Halomarina oriensis]MWG35876.1 branched-chain amino acid ABC transporter permease [Halomarina oriensis]